MYLLHTAATGPSYMPKLYILHMATTTYIYYKMLSHVNWITYIGDLIYDNLYNPTESQIREAFKTVIAIPFLRSMFLL